MLRLSDLRVEEGFEVTVRYRGRPKGRNIDQLTVETIHESVQPYFIGQSQIDKQRVSVAGNTEALGLPQKTNREHEEG